MASPSLHALTLPAGWQPVASAQLPTFELADLTAGERLQLSVGPISILSGGNLAHWLDMQVRQDTAGRSRPPQCEAARPSGPSGAMASCRIPAGAGRAGVLQYLALAGPGGHRRWLRVTVVGESSLLERHADDLTGLIAQAASELVPGAPRPASGAQAASPIAEPAASPRFWAGPNAGLKPVQVLGLAQQIAYQGMQYDAMSRMWSGRHQVDDYLLLRDGSIRRGWPEVPLEDFDAAASRRSEARQWGRWTARVDAGEGGFYDVVWADGSREKLSLVFLVPAARDERLDGFFYRVGSAQLGVPGQGGTFHSAWGGITFHRDGRFEMSHGGSSDYAGAGGGVSTQQRHRATGRYRLEGTLLDLRFDDGRAERWPFVFTTDEKDWIVVNGMRLLKRK
jgi:hypothetical protein